jgi:hypothetical protein
MKPSSCAGIAHGTVFKGYTVYRKLLNIIPIMKSITNTQIAIAINKVSTCPKKAMISTFNENILLGSLKIV